MKRGRQLQQHAIRFVFLFIGLYLLLLGVASALLIAGTAYNHVGMFNIAADSFKVIFGATIGAISTGFSTVVSTLFSNDEKESEDKNKNKTNA